MARTFACALVALVTASSVEAGKRLNLSMSELSSGGATVATSGTSVFVAWIERTDTIDGPTASIRLRRSRDGGRTFEPELRIADLEAYPGNLLLSTSDDDVHLAWLATQFGSGLPVGVYYCASRDSGATFGAPRLVSGSAPAGLPELRVDGPYVAVAWTRLGSGWAAISTDAGETFDEPLLIIEEGTAVENTLRIALAPPYLSTGWIAEGPAGRVVLYRRTDLTTGGAPSAPLVLSVGTAQPGEMALDARRDCVAVLWSQGESIAFTESTSSGETFGDARTLGTAHPVARPRIGMSPDGTVSLVWIAADSRLIYSVFSPGPIIGDGLSARRAAFPDLSVFGRGSVVAWQAGLGDASSLHCSVATDGVNFRRRLRLSPKGARGIGARVVMSEGMGHVVWQAPRGGALEVYYRRVEP